MSRRPRRPLRPLGDRSSLRLLQLGSFTSSFDRFLIGPLLLSIAGDYEVSLTVATLMATAYFQAYGLMQAGWSIVSDRLGRIRSRRP